VETWHTQLYELRNSLHRAAELAGAERRTSSILTDFLGAFPPDTLLRGLGGHGLAAVYAGEGAGPCVLFRAELDALPIAESSTGSGASDTPGISHQCGHDGHMAMVASLAPALNAHRPKRGRVVLLFQPSEETGEGARTVLDDPRFAELAPDLVFAPHNLPGYPLGRVVLREGIFASTARSLEVSLLGKTSHAAEPERGVSPVDALAEILQGWSSMTTGLDYGKAGLVTVVHAKLGERALGTSPGAASVVATLRAAGADVMARLSERCVALAAASAVRHGLRMEQAWYEEFPCTVNDGDAVGIVERAAVEAGLKCARRSAPFLWTEDFGHFTAAYRGALFGLGAGEETKPLHHPEYLFPDELIPLGTDLLLGIVRQTIGERA